MKTMTKILRRAAVLAALIGVAAPAAAQQQAAPGVPQPKIYALQPSGAKAGTNLRAVRLLKGPVLIQNNFV